MAPRSTVEAPSESITNKNFSKMFSPLSSQWVPTLLLVLTLSPLLVLLLWPSSSSAASRSGAANPAPKIAFLFLTNSPLTFAPLWQIFFSNASSPHLYNIYVHADPSLPIPTDTPPFTSDHFIPSEETQRHTPTLISAARRLLVKALQHDRQNAFFALVSQHCIPLHSFTYLHDTLFQNRSIGNLTYPRSFLGTDSDATTFMSQRYNAWGEKVMLPEVPFDRFKIGSQFFILMRRHAVVVVKDSRLWRKFRQPCNLDIESCYPEEHYMPTLLSMEDPKGCAGYSLTSVNWTGTVDGHPHTYGPAEVSPELIYKLRESSFPEDYLFARKFSPECLEPLLNISDSVIFRD